MKRTRFTEEQIIAVLREQEAGAKTADVCRKRGVSEATFYSGALAVPRGNEIVPLANGLAAEFDHVLLTQDWHPPGHLSFASAHSDKRPFDTIELPLACGHSGLTIVCRIPPAPRHAGLNVPDAKLALRKGFDRNIDSYSAFRENDRTTPTGLAAYLRERGFKRIVLAGIATDYCVQYSAIDARAAGFEVRGETSCCRGIDAGGSLGRALTAMKNAGVELA